MTVRNGLFEYVQQKFLIDMCISTLAKFRGVSLEKITKASIIAKMSRWVPSRSFSGTVC